MGVGWAPSKGGWGGGGLVSNASRGGGVGSKGQGGAAGGTLAGPELVEAPEELCGLN